MNIQHPNSPRLVQPLAQTLAWQDLRALSRWEVIRELCLPLPWLMLLWWGVAHDSLWALAGAFMLFLCCLRVVHDAYHGNVGLPVWADDVLMLIMAAVMVVPTHAVQVTHLRHHRYALQAEDTEACVALQPLWKVVLGGFFFPVRLVRDGWRYGQRKHRGWIIAESLLLLALISGALWGEGLWAQVLGGHLLLMGIGEGFTALFAVWLVHHHSHDHPLHARTLRRRWLSFLLYDMLYHVEHHLCPKVPTRHLATLAGRLDQTWDGEGLLRVV
jgi:fatty acid desaturase